MDASDAVVSITHSASGGGYDGVSGNVEVRVDDDEVPLTGTFSQLPTARHPGNGGTFEVRLSFSADPRLSYSDVRDSVVSVSGGNVVRARRVDRPSNQAWRLSVQSSVDGDLRLSVAGGLSCSEPAAVCLASGQRLAADVSAVILGPSSVAPVLSIDDPRAHEGADTHVTFTVSLNRAAPVETRVDWATSDGTAAAGEDYTAGSGTVSIPVGGSSASIEVAILDDARDESAESFTVTLSSPVGATLADASGLATISNQDPLPKAWIGRFGQLVTDQVADAIERRLSAPASDALRLAGRDLSGSAPVAVFDPQVFPAGAEPADSGLDALLGASSFRLRSGGALDPGPFTVWGDTALGSFSSEVDGVAVEGRVRSVVVGSDITAGAWLAGAAISASRGSGDYRMLRSGSSGSTVPRGDVDSDLVGFYPYASLSLDQGARLWAAAGVGSGTLDLVERPASGVHRYTTDISLAMFAGGARVPLVRGASPDRWSVDLSAGTRFAHTRADAVPGLAGASMKGLRSRVGLEASREIAFGDDTSLVPRLGALARHEAGDLDSGLEVEAGAAFESERWTVDGSLRTLVAHELDGERSWGLRASARYRAHPSGRGLGLVIEPVSGLEGDDLSALWSPLSDAPAARDDPAALRLEAGYGLGTRSGIGLLTPYAGAEFASQVPALWRLGTRWRFDEWSHLALEHRFGDETSSAVFLSGVVRW